MTPLVIFSRRLTTHTNRTTGGIMMTPVMLDQERRQLEDDERRMEEDYDR